MKTSIIITLTLLMFVSFTPTMIGEEAKTRSDFPFELFRSVTKTDPTANVAISPLGAEQAIGMVGAGAAGTTKTEIETLLGSDARKTVSSVTEPSPLTVATSLWKQEGKPFLKQYLETVEKEFGASVEQADFSGNPDGAVRRINEWCSKKTNGKIPSLFAKLGETTRCVVVGAVHFAADWKLSFDKELTSEGSFTAIGGEKIKTNIMSRTGVMLYAETDDVAAITLPYKNEGYAMLVLLPKSEDGFERMESEISSEKIAECRSAMKPIPVDLRMPRFSVESDLQLNEPLKKLGMSTAFSRDADLSKMDGMNDLFLSEVRQKVFVKVDETGTEASSATGAVVAVKSATLKRTQPFYATRPFLYAIVKENEIVFLGRFVKPVQDIPFVDPGLRGEAGEFN